MPAGTRLVHLRILYNCLHRLSLVFYTTSLHLKDNFCIVFVNNTVTNFYRSSAGPEPLQYRANTANRGGLLYNKLGCYSFKLYGFKLLQIILAFFCFLQGIHSFCLVSQLNESSVMQHAELHESKC